MGISKVFWAVSHGNNAMNKKNKSELMAALSRFGYPLFQPEKTDDPNALLADLVESDDVRLMEGFPVVLAHCLAGSDSRLDLDKAENLLSSAGHKSSFWRLVAVSYQLFELYSLGFAGSEKLNPGRFQRFLEKDFKSRLFDQEPLEVGDWLLDPERLKNTFLNYVVNSRLEKEVSGRDRMKLREDFQREYLLSLLLSPKQKELVHKKLRGETMTKTEKEYFSRVVKKKLQALADPDLHLLARKALQ